MANYKIVFYNGILPDKVPLSFEENSFRGDLDISANGISIDYFPFRGNSKEGTYTANFNEFSIEKKESKIKFFPMTVSVAALVIQSNSFAISLYAFDGNYAKKVETMYTGPLKDYYMTTGKMYHLEQILSNPTSRNIFVCEEKTDQVEPLYSVNGVRGRHLDVYEDKCVIKTKASVGSLLSGNVSDGEKTIYYSDCIGVQFKKSGMQIGYLQLETASSTMNNRKNNFFNENSFTFEKAANERMEKIADFVKKKVEEYKHKNNTSTIINSAPSDADELMKFKNLLDQGIITQEEFDAKKKQILGL